MGQEQHDLVMEVRASAALPGLPETTWILDLNCEFRLCAPAVVNLMRHIETRITTQKYIKYLIIKSRKNKKKKNDITEFNKDKNNRSTNFF